MARAERPALMLLDSHMPRLAGVDVVRALRADPDLYFRTVPVVLMTGKAGPENTVTGFADGVTDYLLKPLAPSLVRARVRAWLLRGDASTKSAPLRRSNDAAAGIVKKATVPKKDQPSRSCLVFPVECILVAVMPQSALRQTVRERLANGWLFPAPHKVWVGKGTRQICIVCGTAIGPSEVENEVLGSTTVWSHLPCDSIWREESEPHVRAGGRWSGLTTSLVCARPCVSGSRMGRYSCCRTTSHGLGEA